MTLTSERRRRQRINAALPVKITHHQNSLISTTKNISVLGAYVETKQAIPIGSLLNIWLTVPTIKQSGLSKNVQIGSTGIVFRCQLISGPDAKHSYGVGIFFRSFVKAGERTLSQYINYLVAEEKKIGRIFMRKKRLESFKQKGGR